MSVVMIGALVAQWPVGWLSDVIDRRVVIGLVNLLAGCCAVTLTTIRTEDWEVFC